MAITYTPTTNFGAKDSLPTNDAAKVIKGAEFSTEFTAIQAAFSLAAPTASPTFSGTVTIPTLTLGSTAVTATASELNVLDGITATTAELNILDGVTATNTELNVLDGITATTAELNILDGVTATNTELNVLDGITATTSELNILDGVTATNTELSVLDGITATTAELNYTDGVTSNIQTQLDAKAPLASPTFTGTTTTTDASFNGAVVINEAGADKDFRVESDDNTHMLFVDASLDRVGIGVSDPRSQLEVLNKATIGGVAYGQVEISTKNIPSSGDELGELSFNGVYSGLGITQDGAKISAYAEGTFSSGNYPTSLRFHTSPGASFSTPERMRLDRVGNLLIGGTGTPTASAGNIVLYNGTAPSGNATNGVILYAEDVSASSELKVRDEAGNVTTLSPHNFELIPEGPSEDMAWSYYSERDGKRINVDMLKAIRLLEQLSGKKLVHIV